MNYKYILIETLAKLGTAKTCLGYDYIVYGLLLMYKNPECITCITKSLYIDIAVHYGTTWKCVEKNIRNVITSLWIPENNTVLRQIFNRSSTSDRPTNKEFFKSIYEYICFQLHRTDTMTCTPVFICPSSHSKCQVLEAMFSQLLQTPELATAIQGD